MIDFSEKIKNDPKASEAEKRAAISRAYYACHHLAKAALKAKGIDCIHGDAPHATHAAVVKELTRLDVKLGIRLDQCRSDREWADYTSGSLSQIDIDARMADSLELAKDIRAWAERVIASVPPVGQRRKVVTAPNKD